MGVIIGSKYAETKADLRERIRKETITVVESEAENDCICYFCSKHIDGKMQMLLDIYFKDGKEYNVKRFFVHDSCYRDAKELIYYRGIPVSLN